MVAGPAWYKSGCWDQLEQGDLIPGCPILTPPEDLATLLLTALEGKEIEIQAHIDRANLIIATQTCDLQQQNKIDNVLLCAYLPASEYPSNVRKEIHKGRRVAQFMLDRCRLKEHKFEHQIVDFRAVYSLPLTFVREFAQTLGSRIRLNSPYKERFAAGFGNLFSRVALPRDLSAL